MVCSIAELEYVEFGLEAGVAIGYQNDLGEFFCIANTVNKGAKRSWSRSKLEAIGHLENTLTGKGNTQYGGVRVFSYEGAVGGISVYSNDATGNEKGNYDRDKGVVEKIVKMMEQEMYSQSSALDI